MIVDSSAIMAVLRAEADAKHYTDAIEAADVCRMSTASFVETSIVIETNMGAPGVRDLDSFLRRVGMTIEPLTEEQAHVARQAYFDFGKHRHKAGLNFGDCFSYALARITGEPLLFKGRHFIHTDITSAS